MSRLEELAGQLVKTGTPEAEQALRAALDEVSDSAVLEALAGDFYADPEVSVPTYERLLSLRSGDLGARVQLGFVYFLKGEDEAARRELDRARAQDADDVQVLTLEAALAREPAEKVRLYRRILKKDPHNEVAKGNLRELGALP